MPQVSERILKTEINLIMSDFNLIFNPTIIFGDINGDVGILAIILTLVVTVVIVVIILVLLSIICYWMLNSFYKR